MKRAATAESSIQSIAGLAEAIASSTDDDAVWSHAEALFGSLIGHQLFTVLGYFEASGNVMRYFSNRPFEYPVSGIKAMGPTPWGDLVLKQGKPYIGRTQSDIEWAFPDHELITSMGLQSTCNLPIRAAGKTLGTINLLHEADFYDDRHLWVGGILATLLAPVMARALDTQVGNI